MNICIESLEICLNVSLPTPSQSNLSQADRLALADYLPTDPEELLRASKQKGVELQIGIH